MLESWKACILVAEESESYDTLRPKCIDVYGEVQEYCLPPGKIQWTLQRYFIGRFSFHSLYLSGADARKCCTIHFQDSTLVHAYVLINCFSESKFEMSADIWQRHHFQVFVSKNFNCAAALLPELSSIVKWGPETHHSADRNLNGVSWWLSASKSKSLISLYAGTCMTM